MKLTMIPITFGALGTIPKKLWMGTGGVGNRSISQGNPNYSIAKIGQNTEESSGDSRRLSVSQSPVKDYQLMLVWKTQNEQ